MMEENKDSSGNIGCWVVILLGFIIGIATGELAIPMALFYGILIFFALKGK